MQSTCYIVTSCHENNDKVWNTSCLIMQHKSYTVEQPPSLPSIITTQKYYHYTKVCMSSFSVLGHS